MTRLLDRQLARPEPSSLYDFLQTLQYAAPETSQAQRARALLAQPDIARLARTVRAGGKGLLVREVQGARVIAAEAVHHRCERTPAPALFARLRDRRILPRHEVTYVEAQKIRTLGPLTAFGWLVTTRPAADGHELQAVLATEWGRGKLFAPLASYTIDLDSQGRYRPERDTDGPAGRISYPDDPQRPGLLPSILEPIAHSLAGTIGTVLTALAVVAEDPELPRTVPDAAQSAAHRRHYGRSLVSYQKISRQTPALERLFDRVEERD